MGTRRLVLAAVCAVLLLGGCARGTSSSPGQGASMSSSRPSASGGTAQPGGTTLTGLVEAGVEHGCLILRTGGQTYLLIGGDPSVVRAGAQVRVTGRLAPDIKSYCMQGTPFQVSTAAPAS